MTYCKIEKVEKTNIFGRKRLKNIKIKHKWDLIKIGKFMNTDSDGTTFMVRFKCSGCGAEHQRQFADWSYLHQIGVPNEIMEKYRNKGFDYSLRFAHSCAGLLDIPIPTTFQEDTHLY